MTNLVLLFVCLGLGLLLQRSKVFPVSTPEVLNNFVIYISLPALALIYIPTIKPEENLLFPIFTPYIIIITAIIVIPLLGKYYNWSRETIGCLILTAGLGNTSFVGFPVIEALYGPEALKIALLVDQPGSFVALSTFGIAVASIYSAGKTRKRDITMRILMFPPFITFTIAVLMNFSGLQFEGIALGVLERLGATLTPLALISVGMQLKFNVMSENIKPMLAGLSYKLLLAPFIVFALFIWGFGASGTVIKVTIMEAAMGPMITGSILAITYNLNPRLASMMVGIGIPISFLTLAFWYFILESFV